MGRIIIYLFSGVSTEDFMDKIQLMCNEYSLQYYVEEFDNGNKLAIMGNLNNTEYEELLSGIIPDKYHIK
jgi:hypothetical protein